MSGERELGSTMHTSPTRSLAVRHDCSRGLGDHVIVSHPEFYTRRNTDTKSSLLSTPLNVTRPSLESVFYMSSRRWPHRHTWHPQWCILSVHCVMSIHRHFTFREHRECKGQSAIHHTQRTGHDNFDKKKKKKKRGYLL